MTLGLKPDFKSKKYISAIKKTKTHQFLLVMLPMPVSCSDASRHDHHPHYPFLLGNYLILLDSNP
jgi:hypothetical protein